MSTYSRIFKAYTETRFPPELRQMPKSDHPAALLINHAASHGSPIYIHRGMNRDDQKEALCYGAHTSASK